MRSDLELALREADRLGDGCLLGGHVLLGLLGEGEGVAALILHQHGVSAEHVREALRARLLAS